MKRTFSSLFPAVVLLFTQVALQAQEKQTLFDEFKDGGVWLIPLAIFFTGFLALTIYNIIKIRKKPFLQTEVVEQIMPMIEELDFESAVALCEANPSPLTNILKAGLERLSESDEIDPESIEKAMAEAAAIVDTSIVVIYLLYHLLSHHYHLLPTSSHPTYSTVTTSPVSVIKVRS